MLLDKVEVFTEAERSTVPTMLSQTELAFCRFAAHQKAGMIVELGCWLGSSSIKLIQGLRQAHNRGPLVSFDKFVWVGGHMKRNVVHRSQTLRQAPQPGSPLALDKGQSFKEHYLQNVVSERGNVKHEAITANLRTHKWDGRPIDFLFCDALKSAAVTSNIFSQFIPCVRVGGWIADQDFLWAPGETLYYHLAFWHLVKAEFLRPKYRMVKGPLVCFEVLKTVPVDTLELATCYDKYTLEDVANMICEFARVGIYPDSVGEILQKQASKNISTTG